MSPSVAYPAPSHCPSAPGGAPMALLRFPGPPTAYGGYVPNYTTSRKKPNSAGGTFSNHRYSGSRSSENGMSEQNGMSNGGRNYHNGHSASPDKEGSNGSGVRERGEEVLSQTNLYIRGLKPNIRDQDLLEMCKQFGKIISTKAIVDKQTGLCKGYGFVDFETHDAADRAVKTLGAQGMQAQMAKAVALPPPEHDPTNLYIANLPSHWTEHHLQGLFSQYGTVISTRVLRNQNNESRCVGFVRMESRDKCEEVIKEFNNKQVTDCTQPLLLKFADSGKKAKPKPEHFNINGSSGPTAGLTFGAGDAGYSYDATNHSTALMSSGLQSPMVNAMSFRPPFATAGAYAPTIYIPSPYLVQNPAANGHPTAPQALGASNGGLPYDMNGLLGGLQGLSLGGGHSMSSPTGLAVNGATGPGGATAQAYMAAAGLAPNHTAQAYSMYQPTAPSAAYYQLPPTAVPTIDRGDTNGSHGYEEQLMNGAFHGMSNGSVK